MRRYIDKYTGIEIKESQLNIPDGNGIFDNGRYKSIPEGAIPMEYEVDTGLSRVPMNSQLGLISTHYKGRIPGHIAEFLDMHPWILDEESTDMRNIVELTLDDNNDHPEDNRVDLLDSFKRYDLVPDDEPLNRDLYRRIVDSLNKCKRDDKLLDIIEGIKKVKGSLTNDELDNIRYLTRQVKRTIELMRVTRFCNWIVSSPNKSALQFRLNWIKKNLHVKGNVIHDDSKDRMNRAYKWKMNKLSIRWTRRRYR